MHGPLFKQTFYQKCLLPNLIEPSGSGEEDEDEKIYRAGNQESSLEHSAQLKKEFFYMRCCQR